MMAIRVMENEVYCIRCKHFAKPASEVMNRHGFGYCNKEPNKARYFSSIFPRQCGLYSFVADAAREEYLQKRLIVK